MNEPPLRSTEEDLYKLFDTVWDKFYNGVKNGYDSALTPAEQIVLDCGGKWLQDVGWARQEIAKKQEVRKIEVPRVEIEPYIELKDVKTITKELIEAHPESILAKLFKDKEKS